MVDVKRTQWSASSSSSGADRVVREEPLEIRIGGVPVAVVMRTPGHDLELASGFLVTERVVASADQVASIRHCTTVEAPESENNVVLCTLAEGVDVDLARLRRNLFASSSCGLCGKATIDNVMTEFDELAPGPTIAVQSLYALPDALREEQEVFSHTGGLHAAGIFEGGGTAIVIREDVGRHNAVDKTIGFAMARRRDLSKAILMVSGRVSYEIVQKAVAARIPIIAAVSAPSSLAIDLAQRAGLTLAAFVRGEKLSVYSHPQRITS